MFHGDGAFGVPPCARRIMPFLAALDKIFCCRMQTYCSYADLVFMRGNAVFADALYIHCFYTPTMCGGGQKEAKAPEAEKAPEEPPAPANEPPPAADVAAPKEAKTPETTSTTTPSGKVPPKAEKSLGPAPVGAQSLALTSKRAAPGGGPAYQKKVHLKMNRQ
uniref:Uncharacterized protein n=1 Tax=Romanomermis culicivorax TaxID=13658 RepID=A0A915K8V9_ROMCU